MSLGLIVILVQHVDVRIYCNLNLLVDDGLLEQWLADSLHVVAYVEYKQVGFVPKGKNVIFQILKGPTVLPNRLL